MSKEINNLDFIELGLSQFLGGLNEDGRRSKYIFIFKFCIGIYNNSSVT